MHEIRTSLQFFTALYISTTNKIISSMFIITLYDTL